MINISFFSYKGGAGRTSLLYNTLPFIAKELGATNREPIVVVDLDIDSKGLSYLLNAKSSINAIQVLRGDNSIGFRSTEPDIGKHPFFKELTYIGHDIGLPREDNKSVIFISAHCTNDDNRYLNNSDNFDASNISLKLLNRLCQNLNCKAIIMDTPAGEQLAGKAALAISKKIVTTMRITKQFRDGTYEFLSEKSQNCTGKEFILVPNVVPNTEGTEYNIDDYMQEIKARAQQSVSASNKLNLVLLDDKNPGINEVKLFKFEEKNLYKESQTRKLLADECEALQKYQLLAKELIK